MINYYNNYNNYSGFSGDNVMWPRGLTRYNYVENPLRGLWNRFGMENVLLISRLYIIISCKESYVALN